LKDLQSKLDPNVEIWVGGDNQALRKRPPENIKILTSLHDIYGSVKAWRAQQKNRVIN
jgi:hypothetical protein